MANCKLVNTAAGFVLLILVTSNLTSAELFHEQRDEQDYLKYVQHTQNNVVVSEQDAECFLGRYGYMTCTCNKAPTKRRRKRFSFFDDDFFSLNEETHLFGDTSQGAAPQFDACKANFYNGIITYQRKNNLTQTGFLDEATKAHMSEQRCGVPDKQEEFEKMQLTDPTKARTEPDTKPPTATRRRRRRRSVERNVLAHSGASRSRRFRSVMRNMDEVDARDRAALVRLRRTPHFAKRRRRRRRLRRSVSDGDDTTTTKRFGKESLRWRLLQTGMSSKMNVDFQRYILHKAFRMWSEVSKILFVEDNMGPIAEVDIEIAFGKGRHQNCLQSFDGEGGEIAHSEPQGPIHIDDDENFVTNGHGSGIDVLKVVLHEIGHSLGLAHEFRTGSIMFPLHMQAGASQAELDRQDRNAIQGIYGKCSGAFDTVFDWIRLSPDKKHLLYNTYFFRGNHYWMYDNRNRRPRYGDPLLIPQGWRGVPSKVDGYAQNYAPYKPPGDSSKIFFFTFFFSGNQYYAYDSNEDTVETGYPRLIASDFGPKSGSIRRVPDQLDAVYLDTRDKNIYFFKREWVYVYNTGDIGRGFAQPNNCCERVVKFVDEFPLKQVDEGASGGNKLNGDLDTVYHSFSDNAVYFFKGDDYWRNDCFSQGPRKNCLVYQGKWNAKWNDLCDIE